MPGLSHEASDIHHGHRILDGVEDVPDRRCAAIAAVDQTAAVEVRSAAIMYATAFRSISVVRADVEDLDLDRLIIMQVSYQSMHILSLPMRISDARYQCRHRKRRIK